MFNQTPHSTEEIFPKVAEMQENRCRVCLEVTESTIWLLNPANIEETLSYWDVLRLICKIETDNNETTPQIICAACSDRAEVAYEFKVMCENSDKILRSQVTSNNPNIADGIKVEYVPIKVECDVSFKENITTDPDYMSTENPTDENILEPVFDFASDTSINSSCTSYKPLNFISMARKREDYKSSNTKNTADLKPNSIKFTPEKENGISNHNKIFPPNACPICGKDFKHSYNLNRHMKVHDGIKKHECKECGMRFMLRSGMLKHALCHSNERTHKCKQCNSSFKFVTNLKRHVLTVHKKVKEYKCTACPQEFASQYSVDRHVSQVHLNVRDHKCTICGKSFTFKTYLKKHEGVHTGDRNFSCEVCGKKFKYSYSVDRHMKLCHSGKRRYSCNICSKKFKYAYSVNRHMNVCHFD